MTDDSGAVIRRIWFAGLWARLAALGLAVLAGSCAPASPRGIAAVPCPSAAVDDTMLLVYGVMQACPEDQVNVHQPQDPTPPFVDTIALGVAAARQAGGTMAR